MIKKLFAWLKKSPTRPGDTGLFDPYLPVTSLKPLSADYRTNELEEPSVADQSLPEEEIAKGDNFLAFKLIVAVILTVFLVRLVVLQISQGQANYALAEGNRLKTELVPAPRGLIYDKNGVALVQNVPSFAVGFQVADLPKKADRPALYAQIGAVLNLDAKSVEQKITGVQNEDVAVLLDGLTRDQALTYELRVNGITGIEVVTQAARQYSSMPSTGQILGYVGKINADEEKARPELLPSSTIGKSGLEQSYDQYLQGISGAETIEVDSQNHAVRSVSSKPAEPGKSLILSLDSKLQAVTAQALSESIQKSGAVNGAAVAIDVRTGDVLALVSIPDFDANAFADPTKQAERQQILTNPDSPLLNRAIAGQYPSGSTIKPVYASAALAEKVISPTTKIDTSAGKIVVGNWTFSDWKTHGIADVKQAIAESNNIFFYTIGGGNGPIGGLGVSRLDKYLTKFGFGKPTGIDIVGEASGLVPTPDWKQKTQGSAWYLGDTYNLSIGQGDLLVTPLQMANATATIANGGTIYAPKLVKTILNNDGTVDKQISPRITQTNVVGDDVLSTVRDGMRLTVTGGSGRSLNDLPIPVAAKTGTAQFDIAKVKTHSWFTAFAPYGNPEIAVTVIVEGGGEGYAVAAPVAKDMLEQYFNLPLTPIVPAP
ncbi:MAG TPA: penicillin-binding protein 2 [Candidatus Saccharimonadales bacterium]|nr:penicillin-binding protein 2 [Candidatus Saccharimonadales bacterium]